MHGLELEKKSKIRGGGICATRAKHGIVPKKTYIMNIYLARYVILRGRAAVETQIMIQQPSPLAMKRLTSQAR